MPTVAGVLEVVQGGAVSIADLSSEPDLLVKLAPLPLDGVHSLCLVPLANNDERTGFLALGRLEGGFGEEEVEIASVFAAQVALALELTRARMRSQVVQYELTRERDRLELMLGLNNAVVSNLELRDLFAALSSNLRRLIGYDSASLLLPDSDACLRVHAIDFPDGRGYLYQDMLLQIDNSNAGTVFRTGKGLLVGTGGAPFRSDAESLKIRIGEGFQSILIVPLLLNMAVQGVLVLGSRREKAFTPADLDFATEIGRQIAIAVGNALEHRALSESKDQIVQQKSYLEEEIRAEQDFEDIVGSSRALRAVLQQVDSVAPTDSTVLIQGETGTGKELIARAIHERSSRRDRTFVKINCAAIPLGLLESELFGHERGAFTGAIARKVGRFELAHRGTLFLDEIGDIPLELQPKLLRVLQEQEFERLGSNHTQRVDVRVIAATNQNLGSMVESGRFRGDLFYRFNIFPLTVPPLRERPEDVPLLVRYFTSKYARRMNKHIERISGQTLQVLAQYGWPGNVRELQNFVERAVILSVDGELRAPLSELKIKPAAKESLPRNGNHTLREMEREHILEVLRQTNWVVGGRSGAAARLGMKRTSLLYRMEKLGISKAASSQPA